jgi:hypothetical protein
MIFNIFIDESGMANPLMHKNSPYFTVCGMVINQEHRNKLNQELTKLKIKHFKKDIVIHTEEIRDILKTEKKLEDFSKDLDTILNNTPFFLLYSIVDNEKANRFSWNNKASYKKCYRELVGNLIKFLIAKNSVGHICAEASTVFQDIILYENFFHYLANGIKNLAINPEDVKRHLTSVTFVTKANNDAEEQIADLFGCIPRVKLSIDSEQRTPESLDSLEAILLSSMEKHLFKFNFSLNLSATKKRLYKEIYSFSVMP